VKQYYLPDIANANETYTPKWELEYMTYGLSALEKNGTDESLEVIPWKNLPKSLRRGGGAKYAPYSLEDLTIPSWIKLAKELGDGRTRSCATSL
jgi:endopolyphosphatase